MTVVNQLFVNVLHVAERQILEARNLGGTQTTTIAADPTPTAMSASSTTPSPPAMTSTSSGSGGSGPTSSPLLFFVALGFGVVFTNLWIIVGVKYCFRYNARNRAIRNGEEVDPINLENMPTRPHRRRREKKLMTMDEVNERFPLTKYKNWVASRAREGLPTSGGVNVTAPSSRAGSVRDAEGVIPSSPVGTKESVNTRPATASSERDADGTARPLEGVADTDKKSEDAQVAEKENSATPAAEDPNSLEHVRTTASTVDKHPTGTTEIEDEDEDDHIHTAVPPELLTNPGDSCAICIDTLEEDDDVRGLTCGHAFHAGCLDPWLTSRRACCPLCKADYYTPKPRPEGEAAEATDRTGRRRDPRMNMPQQPVSAWSGLRGNPRLILPGRFGASDGNDSSANRDRRSTRRTRVPSATPGDSAGATLAAGSQRGEGRTNWRPRNPFAGVILPHPRLPGRNRRPTEPAADPSPSQLEAGVVR